jgi:hypothetical protein
MLGVRIPRGSYWPKKKKASHDRFLLAHEEKKEQ